MLKFVRPSDPLSSKSGKPSGCVSEQSIASARASVMVYDDTSKKWIPSGSSSGLSKVHIFQNISNNTFRVVARKLQDHEVVINCIILKGLKYNQATQTFHQWRDNKQVYGLNFSSREDADGFARAMTHALDVLNSNSLPRPPPQPMTQQPQTHYQQANGTYDEDMGYSPMAQRTAIYHQVSPGGPTRLDSSPSASHSRTMTREDVAMIQERRMSTQSQRNNTLPRRKLDMNPLKRELPAVWCSPTVSSTSLNLLGPEKDSSYESIISEDSRPGLQDPINNGNASSPGVPVPPTPPGHHRTSSAPPAPQPPPMSLAPPPPPAPPAAPPCPPAAGMPAMPPAAPPFGGVLAAPAPPFGGGIAAPAPPFGGIAAAAPPPPPPPPGPGLPRSSSNDGNDTSSLAAQLQSAKLRRSNKQSAENSGSSTSSSGSGGPGYGTLGRSGTGMASMMDEMAKTLARRRAAAEKTIPDPGPRESDYGTAERKNSTWGGSNAKMGNGCESSPKPSRRPLASSEESLPKVNGDAGLSELEAVKQEILREMRKEINKMKTDIIEALKTELNRR